jgi:hypothetical protein
LVGAALTVHALRSHRLQEKLIIGAIGLAALREISKESRTHALDRVVAWDKRQRQRQGAG